MEPILLPCYEWVKSMSPRQIGVLSPPGSCENLAVPVWWKFFSWRWMLVRTPPFLEGCGARVNKGCFPLKTKIPPWKNDGWKSTVSFLNGPILWDMLIVGRVLEMWYLIWLYSMSVCLCRFLKGMSIAVDSCQQKKMLNIHNVRIHV